MPEPTVSLANAKAHLSELAERAAAGESILITKRGKAVVRLSSATAPKKPIDVNALRAVTDAQHNGADEAFMRSRGSNLAFCQPSRSQGQTSRPSGSNLAFYGQRQVSLPTPQGQTLPFVAKGRCCSLLPWATASRGRIRRRLSHASL